MRSMATTYKQFGFKSISVQGLQHFLLDVAAPCTHGGSGSKHFTEGGTPMQEEMEIMCNVVVH